MLCKISVLQSILFGVSDTELSWIKRTEPDGYPGKVDGRKHLCYLGIRNDFAPEKKLR